MSADPSLSGLVGRRNDYGHDGLEGGAVMSQASIGAGSIRPRAFFIWAAILSLAFGMLFIGVTALTIGMWLVHQNALTTPVSDLSFFALGAIIVGMGFTVQLRVPQRKIAGVQQAVLGCSPWGLRSRCIHSQIDSYSITAKQIAIQRQYL